MEVLSAPAAAVQLGQQSDPEPVAGGGELLVRAAGQRRLCRLLAVAVLLQALNSLAQFVSSVSVGYFAARCTAQVKARIHSQVLSFSFPCASGYKVGNLTNYAGNGR